MNKFPAAKKTGQEPESKNPSLKKCSSVGTEIEKNSSQMPFGSAILTDTGNASKLKNNGISHIIHAALMPQGNNESLFLKKAVLAIQNSIILADRYGFEKLATCFLAGGIFCRNDTAAVTKPRLAEALIRGALSQLEQCEKLQEVIFVDFDADYLKDARDKIKESDDCPTNIDQVKVKKGVKEPGLNLLHKSLHGANVIVNSENAEMSWGGGISGNIEKELGGEGSQEANNVDQQRKSSMKEFNKLINQPEDSSDKITWQGRYESQGTDILFGGKFFYFVSSSVEDHPFLPREFTLSVSLDHPIFESNPPKLNQEYKFSYKKAGNENKNIFRKGDPIEVEEVNDDGRTKYTCPQCRNEYNTKDKPLVEGKYCSQDCKKVAERNKTKTCAFCSKTFSANSGTIYDNKDYCSNECSLKQQEKDKDLPPPKQNLVQAQTQAISDIQQALNSEPKLTNSDLLSDYQNWESMIKKLNSESEINVLKEKVLNDIKIKRKNKQESAARDQKINEAHAIEQKVNLLGEMGSSLGEHSSEQQTKLEEIKKELSTKPAQLREGIQKQLSAQMTAFQVEEKDLPSAQKNKLEQLKNETEFTKIQEIEKEVSQKIGEIGVWKKLTSLEQEVENCLQNIDESKKQSLKDKLLELISSPNVFYQNKKLQFQALLQKLEQVENQNQAPNKPKFPLKTVTLISLLATVILIGLVAIIFRKRKINSKIRRGKRG